MAIILFGSQCVKDKLWCPVAPLGGVSIHLANSPNEFSWNIIFPDINNTLILWHTLYSKVNDDSASVMLNQYIISNWKFSTYRTLWTHHPQISTSRKFIWGAHQVWCDTHLVSDTIHLFHPSRYYDASQRDFTTDSFGHCGGHLPKCTLKWTPCALYTQFHTHDCLCHIQLNSPYPNRVHWK